MIYDINKCFINDFKKTFSISSSTHVLFLLKYCQLHLICMFLANNLMIQRCSNLCRHGKFVYIENFFPIIISEIPRGTVVFFTHREMFSRMLLILEEYAQHVCCNALYRSDFSDECLCQGIRVIRYLTVIHVCALKFWASRRLRDKIR